MKLVLNRSGYERLIKQLLKIDESMDNIIDTYSQDNNLYSKEEIKQFINNYIIKVETLFEEINVIKDNMKNYDFNINSLPFVVLESYFIITDENNKNFSCRLCADNTWDRKSPYIPIFYLSESGFNLLGKEVDQSVYIDIGGGMKEYLIKSIKII